MPFVLIQVSVRLVAIIVLGCVDARGIFTYVNACRLGSLAAHARISIV